MNRSYAEENKSYTSQIKRESEEKHSCTNLYLLKRGRVYARLLKSGQEKTCSDFQFYIYLQIYI